MASVVREAVGSHLPAALAGVVMSYWPVRHPLAVLYGRSAPCQLFSYLGIQPHYLLSPIHPPSYEFVFRHEGRTFVVYI